MYRFVVSWTADGVEHPFACVVDHSRSAALITFVVAMNAASPASFPADRCRWSATALDPEYEDDTP